MKKSITINIPEPCHEGWHNMTPTQKGRFCGTCEKEVIDFSKKRDEDLVKELAGKTNVCGRFNAKQLDREVILERKSGYSVAPYAASLLLPLTLLTSNPVSATETSETAYTSLGIGKYSNATNVRYQVTTTGKITDSNGKPIFNVEITVKESGKSEVSGLRGDYQIKSLDHETLIFKKDGFIMQEIKLEGMSGTMDIQLHNMVLEAIICGPKIVGKIAAAVINSEEIIEVEEVLEGDISVIEEEVQKENETTAITIKGTVTDEMGPLPGVNILIKGAATGTQTDFDGHYEIQSEPNQILEFSYLGFITKEITVSNVSTKIDILMEEGAVLGGLVMIVAGGISVTDNAPSTKPFSDIEIYHDPERIEWKRKLKESHDNEIEFKRIKQARKKAARLLKKKSHKRQ